MKTISSRYKLEYNLSVIFEAFLTNELKAFKNINFVYSDDASLVPDSGKAIYSMYCNAINKQADFVVFSGSNDASKLYFTPKVNLLYRTLHDMHHAIFYPFKRGTTKLKDEQFLNCFMAFKAYQYAFTNYGEYYASLLFFAVYYDTVGQSLYYAQNGQFCVNQRHHTITLLNESKGMQFVKQYQLALAREIIKSYLIECGVI